MTGQLELDRRNEAFWSELCGSGLARALGITGDEPDALQRFDEHYFALYPYLRGYVDRFDLRGRQVLEIGLGYGTLSQYIAERGAVYHGLESRVPLVDHEVVEFAATLPADVKFRNGELKHALKRAGADVLPPRILDRKDKKGFPVPLGEWMHGELRDFFGDTLAGPAARQRPYLDPRFDLEALISREGKFSRNLWALLSLELWQQEFHDRAADWRFAEARPAAAGTAGSAA